MRLGAHVSVAGGLHNAIHEALDIGADTFQMFSKIKGSGLLNHFPTDEISALSKSPYPKLI